MKKIVELFSYKGSGTPCDDCEGEYIRNAKWVISNAGPNGYLYLCIDHKNEFLENLSFDIGEENLEIIRG